MSNQISGLISRYTTNSKPQDTTQKTCNLTRYCDNEEIRLLSWTSLRKGAMDQGATSAAMSYSCRRDAATTHVTAGGPTLRRTAAPQTHVTQHGGRQRQRSRYRPTDSLQLPADQRPGTVDNVGKLVSARQRRRTRLRPTDSLQLSRLTYDPTRSTTSPPDGLTSALLADPRRQYLPHFVDHVDYRANSSFN